MAFIGKTFGMVAGMMAFGGAALASDLVIDLSGAGSSSGAPLSATVSIDVTSAKSATLHIANTSPSPFPGAPVLTRLGFNLAGGPAASCLSVSSPSNWSLGGSPQPFCGVGGTGKAAKGFAYEVTAKNPMPKNGVAAGATLELVLSVKASCAYTLSADSFLDAGVSPSGGELVQWAAKFQVVGADGEDSGCGRGDVDLPEEPKVCTPVYTWSEFIATAAESWGSPSDYYGWDTRAGSVEYNFNGGHGFDGVNTDRPFEAAILTLRNGASRILEQWQLNRRWANAVGCEAGAPFYRCWISAPLHLVDLVLSAAVPTFAGSSNDGFDLEGDRVEISGEILMDYAGGDVHGDNAHQTLVVTWTSAAGLDTAQLLLRGRYDHDLSGLDGTDPMVPLFRRNFPLDDDMQDPGVVIIEETETTLTIALNVEAGTVAVCEGYADAGMVERGYATVDSGSGGYATVDSGNGGNATVDSGNGAYATVDSGSKSGSKGSKSCKN